MCRNYPAHIRGAQTHPNMAELLKYKVKNTRCTMKCPHGMMSKTMPIRPDYNGIHYTLIRDFKNHHVALGSWVCTSCAYCASVDCNKQIVTCKFDERTDQMNLF